MRYYLYIPLPEPLEGQVSKIGAGFQGDFHSRPHITILSPRELREDISVGNVEKELVYSLEKSLADQKPFTVEYEGIDYFEDYSTIYIPVVRSSLLVRAHELVSLASKEYLVSNNGPFDNMPTPHISLASRLSLSEGRIAWEELKDSDFSGQFRCDRVVLMRRKVSGDSWEEAKSIKL